MLSDLNVPLTFFYRQMKPLVVEGTSCCAAAVLRIREGKRQWWAFSEAELKSVVGEDVKISLFK